MYHKSLDREVQTFFAHSHDITYFFSPFISVDVAEKLIKEIDSNHGVMVSSWRTDHLLNGVSHLELYEVCQRHGWTLFINDRLHMKVYARDLEVALIGSANLTARALGDGPTSNHEVLVEHALRSEDRMHLLRIQAESILVTDEVHAQYVDWLASQKRVKQPPATFLALNNDTTPFHTSMLPHSDTPQRLWEVANGQGEPLKGYELPAMEHDLAMLDLDVSVPLDEFVRGLQTSFFERPFIKAFEAQIDADGIPFGSVKQWVQSNCSDVPTPFRRELTFLVQALIHWFPALRPGEFEVIRPIWREVIRRIK